MPIETISAEEALARASANKNRIYPKESSGRERLMPFARPITQAGFSFDMSSKIFATGSCFARYIEKSLIAGEFNVVSSPTDIEVPKSANVTFQLFKQIHDSFDFERAALGAQRPGRSCWSDCRWTKGRGL